MKRAVVVLADGFEEIEAISVVDILRRAGVDAKFAGLECKFPNGAHNIKVEADILLSDVLAKDFDMIVLPGGLPGAEHLANSKDLQDLLKKFDENAKFIAAICAAPMALASAGVLKQSYTCYPGFEGRVKSCGYTGSENVVRSDNIITSRGPATAMEFALELVRNLCGEQIYADVKDGLLFVK